MGLTISVGYLADLVRSEETPNQSPISKAIGAATGMFGGVVSGADSFRATMKRLNRELRAAGLPEHHEPEVLSDGFSSDMWGYSGLHYLRRIAAHDALGHELPPPGPDDLGSDPIAEAYYERAETDDSLRYFHLMAHSDAEGFYLPSNFPHVLFTHGKSPAPGAMVGSVPRLMAECLGLADIIGMPSDADPWSDVMIDAIEAQGEGEGWRRYGRESHACLILLQACRASIRTGAAIVFC